MTERKSSPPRSLTTRDDEDGGASAPQPQGSPSGDASPPRQERPASVRETMRPSRRYQPSPSWSKRPATPPAKRPARPPAKRRGSAPPPARAISPSAQRVEEVRQVEVGGELWTVRVQGSTEVGSGADRGPRMLSVSLEAPEQGGNPGRTAYVLANALEDIAEEGLVALVEGAIREPDVTSGSQDRRRRAGRRGRSRHRGAGRVS